MVKIEYEKIIPAAAVATLIGLLTIKSFIKSRKYAKDRKALAKIINEAARKTPFLTFSAQKIAKMIMDGEVTSEEVVNKFIEQIKTVEPYINCVTDDKFEEAVSEAKKIDSLLAMLRRTDPARLKQISADKPFLGVPFISKEAFQAPGLRYTSGLVAMKNNRGVNWNPVVWRVKQAGGIFLANGNTSEACMWYESYNKVYGTSNNPYDPSRTVGGSSGGGCALVTALGAPFAITSDVGGSTRIPALFNGLFGHKPSGGAVPGVRTVNKPSNLVEVFCQMGVSCRHCSDVLPLKRIIAGPITDHEIKTLEITEDENRWKHLHKTFNWDLDESNTFDETVKIIVLENQPRGKLPTTKTQKDQQEAKDKIVEAFKKNGNPIEYITLPLMNKAFDLWGSQLQQGEEDPKKLFAEKISVGRKNKIWPFYEFFKHALSGGLLSDFTLPVLSLAIFDYVGKRLKPKWVVATENVEFDCLKKEIYDLLGTPIDENGHVSQRAQKVLMVSPSLPMVAPKHGPWPLVLYSSDVAATAIYNVLQLPATQVPTGLGRKKVPAGAQIIGGYGRDALCLSAAGFLENEGICYWSLPYEG